MSFIAACLLPDRGDDVFSPESAFTSDIVSMIVKVIIDDSIGTHYVLHPHSWVIRPLGSKVISFGME